MEGTTIAGKKTARTGLIALVSLALAAMLGLAACGGGGGAAAEVSGEDRTNATQDDPAYAEFFDKLLQYKKVADLDVQDVSITVSIQAVQASTAREDSTQVNYRYAVTEASMNVNGVPVSYSADKGFSKN